VQKTIKNFDFFWANWLSILTHELHFDILLLFSRVLGTNHPLKPLEKESHEFLGSKRDDRFSNPFFEMVPKTCQGSFFVPALA